MHLTMSHWGVHVVLRDEGGESRLAPFPDDSDPSPIGLDALDDALLTARVSAPAVRASWLEHGPGSHPERRGLDPFVEVDWDEAVELVAGELSRVIAAHGNTAVFGGSYGWASAGRFHHSLGQLHRFLNLAGGYVRHVDTYSTGAARVLLPHVVASMDDLGMAHTSWDVIADHTELFVSIGGLPVKNGQVSGGGATDHRLRRGIAELARGGGRFVNISPVRDDLVADGAAVDWFAIRPGTDTALLLGVAHTLLCQGWLDREFLDRYTTGFERFARYLRGDDDNQPKSPEWASGICGIEAVRIRSLAQDMATHRTMLNIAFAVQRAHHGEQPFWAVITVASMLGQVGLPGGGFGFGYGAMNHVGSRTQRWSGPTFPQDVNPVSEFIPCARIADLLLHPGERFSYNGAEHTYPNIRFVYWAGGNPFHHHQDLHRLVDAWRRPEVVVVNEPYWTPTARLADVVLPVTTTHERDDIGFATLEPHVVAMRRVREPYADSLDDHEVFRRLATRLGFEAKFTLQRTPIEWLRHLYGEFSACAYTGGTSLPDFDEFWERGFVLVPDTPEPRVLLSEFRQDPDAHPLATPSGKIEVFSDVIDRFGYSDCPGHACWLEPAEWLGAERADAYPLHLLSDQPAGRLHSQSDHGAASRATKSDGRELVRLNPADSAARGISDGSLVRVFNDRGSCLAVASVTDAIAPRVARIPTGAWFAPVEAGDPTSLELLGNPNVLTIDIGASQLSQGCSAQTCLVDVEPYLGQPPDAAVHCPPPFVDRRAGPSSLPEGPSPGR